MCRICGNQKTYKIYSLCSNMKIMGENFAEGKCDIVSCEECGFVYNQFENAEQSNFDNYYLSNNSKTMDYYDILSQEIADEYFQHIYTCIKPYINKESKILDIAGGYGEVAQYLLNEGYANVTVLEMKPECIKYIKEKGLNVIEGNFLEVDINEKYDMLICSHDLEHFINIDVALKKMKNIVHEDGYFFVEVPNAEKYAELERAPYHFLTYEHVCHFSEKTIYNIANSFGFETLFIDKYIKCNDYPCIYTVMKNNSQIKKCEFDAESRNFIFKYIQKCKIEMEKVIKQFENSDKPLIIWGIGASTAQLLNNNFDKCNVIQLIDSNPNRQGIRFEIGCKNLVVEDPIQIVNEEAIIFILPTAYKKSIEENIRNYGLQNDIIGLK